MSKEFAAASAAVALTAGAGDGCDLSRRGGGRWRNGHLHAERLEDALEVRQVTARLFDHAGDVQIAPGMRSLILAVHRDPAVEARLLQDVKHVRPRHRAPLERR